MRQILFFSPHEKDVARSGGKKKNNNPNIQPYVDNNINDDILIFGTDPNFMVNYDNRLKKIFLQVKLKELKA